VDLKAEYKVAYLQGAKCALHADQSAMFARISFAFLELDQLKEAGARLGTAIAESLEHQSA
jgi:DNA-binding transcriptional MocR family regulator